MKLSAVIDPVFNIPLAIGLVVGSTLLQAGEPLTLHNLLVAQQRTPTLWALDLCSLLLITQYAAAVAGRRATLHEMDSLRLEHRAQLEAMIERSRKQETSLTTRMDEMDTLRAEINAKLEQANSIRGNMEAATNQTRYYEEMLTARTTELERLRAELEVMRMEYETKRAEVEAFQEQVKTMQQNPTGAPGEFEEEMREMARQLDLLTSQVDQHTRQFDAVNMALEYQRAELQQLRLRMRALKSGESDKPGEAVPAFARKSANSPVSNGATHTTPGAESGASLSARRAHESEVAAAEVPERATAPAEPYSSTTPESNGTATVASAGVLADSSAEQTSSETLREPESEAAPSARHPNR
jgi:myosin heavy subunit